MKRKWNWPLWAGFVFVVVALFSYPFFAQFPVTRDFPWANLLLFGVGGILLVTGLVRAFGKPQLYRGKILGPIFALLSLLAFSLFAYGAFYLVRQLPASTSAPRVGEKAPEFTLPDQSGKQVALADLLAGKAALLIFYRGHW
jgi:AhpC/TSA family protein